MGSQLTIGSVWTETKKHRGWYLVAFLLSGLPLFIATLWGPVVSSRTVSQWLAENNWPHLGTLVIAWIVGVCVLGAVIVFRSIQTAKKAVGLDGPLRQDHEIRFIDQGRFNRTIRVTVNGSHFWTGLAFLDTGSFEKGWKVKNFPVRVYTEPNDTRPRVETRVYSAQKGLVDIKDNQLKTTPDGWDQNASERAIEIVNEHRIPVFQMVLSAANQLDIFGVFSEAESKSGWRMSSLFKYPSNQHRGELAEELFPLTAKSLYQLYLESCGTVGGSHGGYPVKMNDREAVIDHKVCIDLDSRAAWLNVFMAKHQDVVAILKAFAPQHREMLEGELRLGAAHIRLNPGEKPERGGNLVFTGVVGIYHEDILLPEQPDEIVAEFKKYGAHVRFYGPDYVVTKNSPLSN